MKKIFSLSVLTLLLASCASNIQGLKYPSIKGKSQQAAEVYFSPELEKKYQFGGKTDSFKFNALDHSDAKPLGVQKDNDWGQNIGQLSITQFKNALDKGFADIQIVSRNNKKAERSSYLIVPSIASLEIEINDVMRSSIKIIYKIDVYNKSGQLVYSEETAVKEKGKYKGFVGLGVGPVPIMGQVNLKPNENSMIFEAVSNGVDKAINNMLKSKKL